MPCNAKNLLAGSSDMVQNPVTKETKNGIKDTRNAANPCFTCTHLLFILHS